MGLRRTISIEVDGKRLALGLPAGLLEGWQRGDVAATGAAATDAAATAETDDDDDETDPAELHSTMAGTVVKWLAEPGAELAEGDPVLVLEAMKMETTIAAHRSGPLGAQLVRVGDAVELNTALATIG